MSAIPPSDEAVLFRTRAGLAAGLAVTLFAGAAHADVVIAETIDDGRPVFEIRTPSATYVYSKAGASLISLIDADGVDWIQFRLEGSVEAPDGSFGWYRGLPNMTRHEFGHSNGGAAVSVTEDPLGQPLDKATIVSTHDTWRTQWEFYPDFARLTVMEHGEDYWLLYEGVPGGALDPADLCWPANDQPAPCSRRWRGDIATKPEVVSGLEWMVFGDPALDRSLVLLHNDDDVVDQHRLMSGMTVFGFGRGDPGRIHKIAARLGLDDSRSTGQLETGNQTMLITFAEAVQADLVEAHIRRQALHPSFAPQPETLTADNRVSDGVPVSDELDVDSGLVPGVDQPSGSR